MKYRILDDEEWDKLVPLVSWAGFALPSPQNAIAAVAEDSDGKIVGVQFLQTAYHVEPLIIAPNSNVNFIKLFDALKEAIRELMDIANTSQISYYCMTTNSVVGQMAVKSGLRSLEGMRVFVGSIGKEIN